MFKKIFSLALLILFTHAYYLAAITANLKKNKIVGLLQVRNEEFFIEQCLRALSCYTDSIIIVDDASSDNTKKIITTLKEELNIEKIIFNEENSWQKKDERHNKQLLLDYGRKVGGTHFIFIDADEIFSSYCLKNNWLRNKILSMKKGQVLYFPMVNLWNGIDYWRIDEAFSFKTSDWGAKPRIFCDDENSNYNDNKFWDKSGTIHFNTIPENRKTEIGIPKDMYCHDIKKTLIHLNCVNLDRVYDKRIWYMCFEFIRKNEKSTTDKYKENANKINQFYTKYLFFNLTPQAQNDIKLAKSFKEWFDNYSFFKPDNYKNYNQKHRIEVLNWFKKYGVNYFKDLDIWYLDWTKQAKQNFL